MAGNPMMGLMGMQAWNPNQVPAPTATSPYMTPGTYSSGLQTANAAWQAPQTASQQMQGAVSAGNQLPQQLRIIGNPNATPDANTIAQYQNFYRQQYSAPAEAQMRANAYTSGRSDSAFEGGRLGGLEGQNRYQEFMAGQQLADNYLNRLLQARSSFAGLEGNMSQAYNNLNQQRGQGMAGFAMQDAANRNNWNMQGAQMRNNFNLQSNQQNFGQRLQSYNAQQEANRWNTQKNLSLGSGIGGALGGLASAFNPFTVNKMTGQMPGQQGVAPGFGQPGYN